jgi:hypothetical protein
MPHATTRAPARVVRLPSFLGREATPGAGAPATAAQAGLGGFGAAGHMARMPRPMIALLLGVAGFALYVGAVVALADFVLPLHWTIQFAYFLVAGLAWVPPARALMFWAARAGS